MPGPTATLGKARALRALIKNAVRLAWGQLGPFHFQFHATTLAGSRARQPIQPHSAPGNRRGRSVRLRPVQLSLGTRARPALRGVRLPGAGWGVRGLALLLRSVNRAPGHEAALGLVPPRSIRGELWALCEFTGQMSCVSSKGQLGKVSPGAPGSYFQTRFWPVDTVLRDREQPG